MKKTFIIMMLGLVLLSFTGPAAASDDAEHGRSPYPGKFYGTVESMPETGRDGIWVINGRDILVTGNTRIEDKYGKAAPGAFVEVKGDYSGKIFTAYKIEVKREKRHHEIYQKAHDNRMPRHAKTYNIKLYGTIESMPDSGYEGAWVIDGRNIEVNDRTMIDETGGRAIVGAFAKVKGIRSGETITGYEIEIQADRR